MRLLDLLIKEYISLVSKLEENEPVENNRIIIEREQFKTLLEKYKYMTFKEKTATYKDMNFIIHDKNNYTMPVKEENSKKTMRKVVINYKTYLKVKTLYETEVHN